MECDEKISDMKCCESWVTLVIVKVAWGGVEGQWSFLDGVCHGLPGNVFSMECCRWFVVQGFLLWHGVL